MDDGLGSGGHGCPISAVRQFLLEYEDLQLRRGRHGGCKEDKDEQSSLPGCGMEFHDFSC